MSEMPILLPNDGMGVTRIPIPDDVLRLESIRLAVANNRGRFLSQLLREASEIEAHIRFGNTRDESVTLGPELFIGNSGDVISFKGENFYRACNRFVRKLDNGDSTHCVKRAGHPGTICEDYDGETYDRKDLDL